MGIVGLRCITPCTLAPGAMHSCRQAGGSSDWRRRTPQHTVWACRAGLADQHSAGAGTQVLVHVHTCWSGASGSWRALRQMV